MASVDAPTRPSVANSSVAAATIAWRRSSAVIRTPRVEPGERMGREIAEPMVVMAGNLVLTKRDVEGPGQPIRRTTLPWVPAMNASSASYASSNGNSLWTSIRRVPAATCLARSVSLATVGVPAMFAPWMWRAASASASTGELDERGGLIGGGQGVGLHRNLMG